MPLRHTGQEIQSHSQGPAELEPKKVGHVNSQLSLAREVLHQLEIAQDNRTLSYQEKWLKNQLKKHSLALSSLQRTTARVIHASVG